MYYFLWIDCLKMNSILGFLITFADNHQINKEHLIKLTHLYLHVTKTIIWNAMNAPLTVTSTIGKYNILILYHSLQYASNHILIKHSTILYQVVRKKSVVVEKWLMWTTLNTITTNLQNRKQYWWMLSTSLSERWLQGIWQGWGGSFNGGGIKALSYIYHKEIP